MIFCGHYLSPGCRSSWFVVACNSLVAMSISLESNRKLHNEAAFLLVLAIADYDLFHYKSLLGARTSSFWL